MHPRLRPPLIRWRVPQVHAGGAVGYVTDPNLIEMFYDGVTPWSLAQNLVGHLQHIVRQHDRNRSLGPQSLVIKFAGIKPE
jgi:hypothetical protein